MKLESRPWKIIKSVFRWLCRNNEFYTIPLAVLIFYKSAGWMAKVDPTAAFFGIEVLQTIVFAIVAVLAFSGVTWLMLWIVWPTGRKLLDDVFINKDIEPWEKVRVALVLFCAYFFGLVWAASLLI